MRLGGQRVHAVVLPLSLPTLGAGEADAGKIGNLWQRLPCMEIFCSTMTASFRLRRVWFSYALLRR
jgi:hypothetical protein